MHAYELIAKIGISSDQCQALFSSASRALLPHIIISAVEISIRQIGAHMLNISN